MSIMADQNPEDLLNTSTPKLTKENEDGKFNGQPQQPSKIQNQTPPAPIFIRRVQNPDGTISIIRTTMACTMVPTVVNQNSPNQQNMIQPSTKKVFLSKNGKIIGAHLVHQLEFNANSANDTGKIAISALSFNRSKIILDHPNCFGWVQIVLVRSKSFWSGLNQIFLD